MKITIQAKTLADALKAVTPAVGRRSTLPILQCVRVQAEATTLSLEATDLEITATHCTDDITVHEDGTAVVTAAALAKAVRTANGNDVELIAEEDDGRARLLVRSGARTLSLEMFDPREWPTIGEVDTELFATVDGPVLADALARVGLCASEDEARAVLCSVAMFTTDQGLDVVATDSYRLGHIRIPATATPNAAVKIPARAAAGLSKVLKHSETVQIHTGQRCTISAGATTWITRLVGGEFPNWRQLLPEPNSTHVEFHTTELAQALKAIASVRRNGAPARLTLGDTCSIAFSERDLGDISERLANATFTGGAGSERRSDQATSHSSPS